MIIPRDKPIPALLELVGLWVPDLSSKHRLAPASIPKFVPPPLRSIYESAGNYPVPYTEQSRPPNWTIGLFGPQDQLLPPDQLKIVGDRFGFIHENQGVWSCETFPDADDPPVYSNSLAYEHGDEEMREVCPSLSHFLTTFCLQELVFRSQELFCVDSEVVSPNELVTDKLTDVWVDGVYVYKKPTHSFYLCGSGLLVMNAGGGFWLAYNEDRFASLISGEHDIRRVN